MIGRGKRSETEWKKKKKKTVKNINKNPQSSLEISPVWKEVLTSHKLQLYLYEKQSFQIKGRYSS